MFDIDAARKAGYDDATIAQGLAAAQGIDYDAAVKAGYTAADMLPSLIEKSNTPAQKDGNFISNALIVDKKPDNLPVPGASAIDGSNLSTIQDRVTNRLVDNAAGLNQSSNEPQNPLARLDASVYPQTEIKQAPLDQIIANQAKGISSNAKPFIPPDTSLSGEYKTEAVNLFGGAASTLASGGAALADAFGMPGAEKELDEISKNWAGTAAENGGDTVFGKASNIVGSISTVLALPEEQLAHLVANAGLFAIPAFRQSLDQNIEEGHSYGDALTHAVAAFGVNMLLPQVATKGSEALAKLTGAAGVDEAGNLIFNKAGTSGAATQFGLAATEGAGFAISNKPIDTGINAIYGEKKDDETWVADPKDVLANMLAFAALRGKRALDQYSANPEIEKLGSSLNDSVNNSNFSTTGINNDAIAALSPDNAGMAMRNSAQVAEDARIDAQNKFANLQSAQDNTAEKIMAATNVGGAIEALQNGNQVDAAVSNEALDHLKIADITQGLADTDQQIQSDNLETIAKSLPDMRAKAVLDALDTIRPLRSTSDAIQEPSAGSEVPGASEAGEDIAGSSQRIRRGEQGIEPAGTDTAGTTTEEGAANDIPSLIYQKQATADIQAKRFSNETGIVHEVVPTNDGRFEVKPKEPDNGIETAQTVTPEAGQAQESTQDQRRLVNENPKQTKSADTGGAQEGDGTGVAQDGSGSDENTSENPLLKSYANTEVKARETTSEKAKKEAETEPAAPKVSVDQTDMFNGQDSLFNSNREQPESKSPLDTTDKSWVIKNKQTGEVMFETFDREKVKALNTDKYVVVPIGEYLASLNNPEKQSAQGAAVHEPGEGYKVNPASARFYSQLRRSIEATPDRIFQTGKGTVLWLEANAPKLGIKKDEMYWSGIQDWLKTQGKVSKDDVLNYLKEGGVQVKDVMLGDTPVAISDEMRDAVAKLGGLPSKPDEWIALSNHFEEQAQRAQRKNNLDEADRFFNLQDEATAMSEGLNNGTTSGEPKYSGYTVPGGENYRELLLTLPWNKSHGTETLGNEGEVERWIKPPVSYRVDAFSPIAGQTPEHDGFYFMGRSENKEAMEAGAEGMRRNGWTVEIRPTRQWKDIEKSKFQSSHFDEPNILAHVRFDTFTRPDGGKTLRVHEIQSDWGQGGKKSGFMGEQAKLDDEIAAKYKVPTNRGEWSFKVLTDAGVPEVEADRWMKAHITNRKVPDAPFVQDTKAWTALTLKHIISHAIDTGHDKVVIINGEQAGDLYDLSKQVSEVIWDQKPSGTGTLVAYDTHGNMIDFPNGSGTKLKPEQVQDYIGKEAAQKLFDQPANKSGQRSLKGDGLKVGGEGMKGFYDGIVKQVGNDILKRLGGDKMHAVDSADVGMDKSNKGMKYQDQTNMEFDITPEMRDKVLDEGMALFQPRKAYNENQSDLFGDPYAALKTRSGTNAEQINAGRNALSDVERRIFGSDNVAMRKGASVLGSAISEDFRDKGYTSLVGQKVESSRDMAIVAQVLRDPRFETFRAFYVKDGKVVGERAYTSRMAGSVSLPRDIGYQVKGDMDRTGASGYWLLHNHPSGEASASVADLRLTEHIADIANGMLGHVIIDHNEYNSISITPESDLAKEDVVKADLGAMSSKPEIPNILLGKMINSATDVAAIAKSLQEEGVYSSIIGRSARGKVVMVLDVPDMKSGNKIENLRAGAMIKRAALETGSVDIFAVVPGDIRDYRHLSDAGLFRDVISSKTGESAVEKGAYSSAIKASKVQEKGVLRYVAEPVDLDFTQPTGGDNERQNRRTQDSTLRTVEGLPPKPGFRENTWIREGISGTPSDRPLTVFRGESVPLRSEYFGRDALGYNSGNAPSGRGVHFTTRESLAEHHAGDNGRVNKYYLDIRNPFEIHHSELDEVQKGLHTFDDYYRWREGLKAKGYDGIVIDQTGLDGGHDIIAFDPHQVMLDNSVAEKTADYSTDKPEPSPSFLEKIKSVIPTVLNSEAVREIKMSIIPMSTGSMDAKAEAQKFMNAQRVANHQWHSVSEFITDHFTPEQRTEMWNAADEQNVLMQQGLDTQGKGLDRLPPEQRVVMERLNSYSKELWNRAVDAEMVTGEGMPFWTPRMAVLIGEDGEFNRPKAKGQSSSVGRNITTTASSLKQRKYLTSQETEDAMKGALGDDAKLVRDVLVMPLAMARLEKAIAGRELVNQLKAIGQVTGKDIISGSEQEGYEQINHPAFKIFRPHMVDEEVPESELTERNMIVREGRVFKFTESGDKLMAGYSVGKDGKVTRLVPAVDQNGDTIFDVTPMNISKDWVGPLKAVMSTKDGLIYSSYMLIKSKAMTMIMASPLTHNMVIAGRALAYDPAAILTLKSYFVGNKLAKDTKLVSRAISAGMVPMGMNRNTMMDVTDIARTIGKQGSWGDPNESWINLSAQKLGNLFHSGVGDSIKSRMDKFGDFYHHDLLWKQVQAIQLYIFNDYSNYLIAKGHPQEAADAIAAHLANRYGGAVQRENMSELARKALNVMLFSRSFNVGNVGSMKDTLYGMPAGMVAKLYKDVGVESGNKAMRAARGKARMGIAADLGMSMLLTSLTAAAVQTLLQNQTVDDITNGYSRRLASMFGNIAKHPFTPDSYNPYRILPTFDNEPGKQDRIDIGADEFGRHQYMRLPTGKVVEDLIGWTLHAPDTFVKKMSPVAKGITQSVTNDKGYGVPVEDPEGGFAKHIGEGLAHVISAQIPFDTMQAMYDTMQGRGSGLDKRKLAGFATGFSSSQGAPGGPQAGEAYAVEDRMKAQKAYIMEDVKRDIKAGDNDEARRKLLEIGYTNAEINLIIRKVETPKQGMSNQARRKFNQHATDEDKEKMELLRQ